MIDKTMPTTSWQFDESVTQVFDDMLERSIPQYDVMREACYNLACRYAQRNTSIVDLGCSHGEAIARLVDHFGVNNRFVGVDVSEPMLEAARTRFEGLIKASVVSIRKLDLRTSYPPEAASVTLCVLTLQFTPIEYRLAILDNIYQHTLPGGALILVEKVIGATASIDKTFVDLYYDLKRNNGYTQEQIDRKRMSLEGVLVPLPADLNVDLLRRSGFSQIDNFWSWMNFRGWIAIK